MSDLINGITQVGATAVYDKNKAIKSSEDKQSKNVQA